MLRNCTLLFSIFVSLSTFSQVIPFDCISARELTDKSPIVVDGNSFGDVGAFDEKGSCFTSTERSPYWFTFEVCKTGTLDAFINPQGTSDFDFVLYDVTNGCGSKTELICNSQATTTTLNNTGIGCLNGTSCDPTTTVFAGRKYAILFSRYTIGSTAGFTLSLGGDCEFSNPALLDYRPKINPQSIVCGPSASITSIVNPSSESFSWIASGPGFVNFSDPTNDSTSVTVSNPGIYRFYFSASKVICTAPLALTDSVDIEFKAITSLFGDSTLTTCESNTAIINLSNVLTGNPPENGTWTDNASSGAMDPNGLFNPYGLGGNQYTFTYSIPATSSCFDTSGVVTINISNELVVLTDSVKCFGGGANYRVFTHIIGGTPSSYEVNGNPQGSAYYSSGFLPNQFQYSFEISDSSGCPSIVLTGTKDCNCITDAGTLSATTLFDCGTQTITAQPLGNDQLDGNDLLEFILYTNTSDVLGSIVLSSPSPSFTFQSPLLANTDYFIAAIAGNNDGSGSVDLNDPCVSISSGLHVKFTGPSAVQISADTLICEGGTAKLMFNVSSSVNVLVTYTGNSQTNQLFLAPGQNEILVSPNQTATYQITSAQDVFGCNSPASGLATVTVSSRPSFSYALANDSVICIGQGVGNPFMVFTLPQNEELSVFYSVNGVIQTPLTGITNGAIFNLQQIVNGKNTFQVYKIVSSISGCTFDVLYPAVNYYYLNTPAVSISADVKEFCSPGASANISFTYNDNLAATVYFNINGAPQTQVLNGTSTINYPVTNNLVFNLDSIRYTEFAACTQPISGTLQIQLYADPTVTLTTEPITCVDPSGRLLISSDNLAAMYNVGAGFSADTIYEFTTPALRTLQIKLGQNCVYTRPFTIINIPPFTLTTTPTHSTCNQKNGSFLPVITGSFVTPISYTFNGIPGNTNLQAGIYQISATDATGCNVTIEDTINSSSPFIFNAYSLDSAFCVAGTKGSIVALASGGDGSFFNYSVDGVNFTPEDTILNLDPRFYTVYAINEKGCIDSIKVKVKSDSILDLNLTALKFLKCFESTDASIKVEVTNSSNNLSYSSDGITYSSNNIFSNLGPGSQTFYAREGSGCKLESSVSFQITRPNPLTITLLSKNDPVCFNSNNGFFILKADGSSNVNYNYTVNGINFQNSGSFSGLPEGFYKLFALNVDGCSTDTIYSTLISPPEIVISGVDTVLNPDLTTGNITIHAFGGVAPLTYSINGLNYFSDSVFTNIPKGEYTIYVKDVKGCISTRYVLVGTVGIKEITPEILMSVAYPNPFSAELRLDLTDVSFDEIKISNTLGQVMWTTNYKNQGIVTIPAQNWSPGFYQINLITPTRTHSLKVIKH